MQTQVVVGRPFVTHVNQDLRPEIGDPLEFLKEKYSSRFSFGLDNLLRGGHYKLMGYAYDFRPHLKKFLYKQNYYGWQEAYAPNKTLLRKAVYGTIEKIIEL
jgi:hypothetical protein